ncbi:unnamed protein product [Lactuca virosa]|uniref:Transposase (putative) gypsy type domain-containing protein n=1 Tax=Lactuca virosa TaxID=75947 RepID=A0AAU9MVY5_9ASTR|nr:unnamed protein product [Lactuca virosa]
MLVFFPTHFQSEGFQNRYGFQLDDGVTIPVEGSVITRPRPSKVGIYLKHFDIGYRLMSSDFLLELLDHHKIHINQLVLNGVNKNVAFEMLCRCNNIVPDFWVFRHFFFICRLRLFRCCARVCSVWGRYEHFLAFVLKYA